MGRGDGFLCCCTRNLFAACCIIAALTMLTYLLAFSCELAWLLESNGDLNVESYLLCVLYFILFVAAFILIHGLVTKTPMELVSWAILIGILAIPELIFVVHMISEHWGVYSVHGLTELIGYLLRITINAFGLMCVMAQCSRWRRENQMLLSKILIDPNHPAAASHHHHPQHPHIHYQQHPQYAMSSTGTGYGGGGTLSKKSFDNFAFNAIECPPLPTNFAGASKNEFNASAFGLHVEPAGTAIGYNSYFGHNLNRSHSLHDIRIAAARVVPPYHAMYTGFENPMLLQKNHKYEQNMYHTIHFKPKVYNKQCLKRNCISMENLKGIGSNSNTNSLSRTSKKSDNKKNSSNNNQCLNISSPQLNNMSSQYFHMPFGYIYDRVDKKNAPKSTSKQSLGTNASSDDCFRYRDVAL